MQYVVKLFPKKINLCGTRQYSRVLSGKNVGLDYLGFERSQECRKFVSWSGYNSILVLGVNQQNECCRDTQWRWCIFHFCYTSFTHVKFHLSPCLCDGEKRVIIEDTYCVYPLSFRVDSFYVGFGPLSVIAIGYLAQSITPLTLSLLLRLDHY